ncbi:MAG: ankyrin repeat domain-containing protein [Lentisphaerota bacterium]
MKMNLFKASLVALACFAVGACSTTVVDNSKAIQAQKQLQAKGVSYNSASFITCASSGDIDNLKLFLDGGMDVNTYYSSTALSAASANGKTDVVKFLLDNGANPNIQTFYGTALILAIKNNHADIVQLLLAAKANPNAESSDGHSALSVAAFTGNQEVIASLVAAGAKIDNVEPVTATTPLSSAAYYGKKDAVAALIKAGANVNYTDNRGLTVIDWSQMGSYNDITKMLIDNGATLNSSKNGGVPMAMLAAMAHQDTEMIAYLVGKGVSVNGTAFGKMPIIAWCAKEGLQKSGLELIKLGADTSAKDSVSGSSAIDYAIMFGEVDLAKALDPSIDTSKVAANASPDPNLRSQQQVIQDYVNDQYYEGTGNTAPQGGGMDYTAAISDSTYKQDQPSTTVMPLYSTGGTDVNGNPTPIQPLYKASGTEQGMQPATTQQTSNNPPAVQNLENILTDQVNSDTQLMGDLRNDPVFKNDASMTSDGKTATVSGLTDASVIGSGGTSFQDFDKQISNDMSTIDTSLNTTPSTTTPPADQK